MKTDPLYLTDSYLREMDGTVIEVLPDGDAKWRVILDKTVFYPMGGGQATDQGTLTAEGWSGEVYQVLMKDGEIIHYIKALTAPAVGMNVHGTINWDRRYKNMRSHSAGHVVDFSMYLLGYSPKQLMPLKGDHDKKPYVIYGGTLGKDIRAELEAKANELVGKNLKFSWYFQPLEELQKEALYLQPGLPAGKPMRALKLEGVGVVADGGTQVHETGEVGKITIVSVEEKDDQTIVRYSLS